METLMGDLKKWVRRPVIMIRYKNSFTVYQPPSTSDVNVQVWCSFSWPLMLVVQIFLASQKMGIFSNIVTIFASNNQMCYRISFQHRPLQPLIVTLLNISQSGKKRWCWMLFQCENRPNISQCWYSERAITRIAMIMRKMITMTLMIDGYGNDDS